jgi:hypothetical protein
MPSHPTCKQAFTEISVRLCKYSIDADNKIVKAMDVIHSPYFPLQAIQINAVSLYIAQE